MLTKKCFEFFRAKGSQGYGNVVRCDQVHVEHIQLGEHFVYRVGLRLRRAYGVGIFRSVVQFLDGNFPGLPLAQLRLDGFGGDNCHDV